MSNRTDWPYVSVIMPMRNEQNWIRRSLSTLLSSDYPSDRIEFIVVDGGSVDQSAKMLEPLIAEDSRISLLHNPYRTAPCGMNIGISAARGQVIVRADAHAEYAPDYVRQCVLGLEEFHAGAVGGCQIPCGETTVERAIAQAMASRFASGGAAYRSTTTTKEAETVYLGAWFKETLTEVGGFDERWVVNQDYELNARIRKIGKTVIVCPQIRSKYFVRPSLRAMANQHFRYGFWRVKTMIAHPESIKYRQFAAPMLVLAVLTSILASGITLAPLLATLGLYLTALVLAAALSARKGGWGLFPLLLLTFPTIHLSWGLGFWRGLLAAPFSFLSQLRLRLSL